MKFRPVEEWVPPDHPWDPEQAISEWCGICGSPEIVHDGNLERAFEWLRLADPLTRWCVVSDKENLE
jgi:hypothetical protein